MKQTGFLYIPRQTNSLFQRQYQNRIKWNASQIKSKYHIMWTKLVSKSPFHWKFQMMRNTTFTDTNNDDCLFGQYRFCWALLYQIILSNWKNIWTQGTILIALVDLFQIKKHAQRHSQLSKEKLQYSTVTNHSSGSLGGRASPPPLSLWKKSRSERIPHAGSYW